MTSLIVVALKLIMLQFPEILFKVFALIDMSCEGISCEGISCEGMSCEGISCEGISCEGMTNEGINCEGTSNEGINCEGISCEGMTNEGMTNENMNKKVFVGVDGCSAGWFAVFLAVENKNICGWKVELFPKFSFIINFLKKEYEKADFLILIDIPIGLKAGGSGERHSDLEARRILKSRKSSIFPVPCREAIYAESYEKACKVNKELAGKSISKQAWNIVPKIRDVDCFLFENEIFREKVKEVAPEICFQSFTGFPMKYSKKSAHGFLERIETLREVCLLTDEIVGAAISKFKRKEVSRDDILDALVAAITAKTGFENGFEYVPFNPETDIKGLKIQMVFCIQKFDKL